MHIFKCKRRRHSLGVKDNGNIIGIAKEHIASIKQDFVTSVNNPSKLSPTVCLSPEEIFIDGKNFIYYCAEKFSGSQVCYKDIYMQ
jgi:ATP-dependent DNA helicase RecG